MEQVVSSKKFGLIRLVMINIIAVDSLRNISITAQAGWIVVSFYILAGIFFLVPCALLTAEMSTGSTQETGGIYIWVKKAFGKRLGFLVIWIQWVYNLVWFPSICGFFAGVIAYVMAPVLGQNAVDLVSNPWYMISMSLVMFWSATAINLFGIKTSSTVSTLGAIIGTLLPMLIIISMAFFWTLSNTQSIVPPHVSDFIPSGNNISSWALFITVMFSLFGLEMSAIHAANVKNAKKNFPRALLISGTVILGSLILSNIAVILVSSQLQIGDVDIVTGLMVSFHYFFSQINMPWVTYFIAITLIFGAFTTTSAWIMGLSRAFMIVSNDNILPQMLGKTNKNDAPDTMLIVQALIFTVFCFSYIFMPSVNEAYWYLSDLTAQLAVIAYIIMFITAIKLKISQPLQQGQYEIYKGLVGTITMAILGCVGCIIAIVVGFIPIDNMNMSIMHFDALLLVGIMFTLIIPFVITIKK
ncbi:amino acid permease [Allofrancisella guangzhouensis]|uniref:Amino acid transporter n=1 Tax=Allofrancisella guangzhouensis TaxID=594679 RepID=A0A0A8E5V8_9GAMM|nr:APC family permease [Allofrancisella guangzhouensis]AJC49403.1 amino acid transporter [Allofrancisella guangzhouensis]MBK2026945.1 amino acid permease [Allofrancisella guangzhouensis]MBK2043947.1 amino acid permease [Allofrancisella guangzhouensis]MBK2046010.1 amino acid permease [Allofrancisella guangzhouensis]